MTHTILTESVKPNNYKLYSGSITQPPRVEGFINGIESVWNSDGSGCQLFNTKHYKRVLEARKAKTPRNIKGDEIEAPENVYPNGHDGGESPHAPASAG